MKYTIETPYSFEKCFSMIEEFGRTCFRQVEMKAKYIDDVFNADFTLVSLGLNESAYRFAFRTREMSKAFLLLPNGDSIEVNLSQPHTMVVNGGEVLYKKFQQFTITWNPEKQNITIPLFYPIQHPLNKQIILRELFRKAKKENAEMYVNDQDNMGKQQRIMASWMLDTFEKPFDIYITKEGDWALYHFQTQCAFESSNWFFEAEGLLEQITSHKGGMTNG